MLLLFILFHFLIHQQTADEDGGAPFTLALQCRYARGNIIITPRKLSSTEDRDPTDHISNWDPALTLTSHLDIQSHDSYGHDHTHAKDRGQRSLCSEVTVNEQMDRRTNRGDCIIPHAKVVVIRYWLLAYDNLTTNFNLHYAVCSTSDASL